MARHLIDHRAVSEAMAELGFNLKGKYFENSDTPYFVEFLSGPLSVGEEEIKAIIELELPTGSLRIISPTDAVKDRLAAYYYWHDLQAFEQAVLIATYQKIDLEDVRRWSKNENNLPDFQKFASRLNKPD